MTPQRSSQHRLLILDAMNLIRRIDAVALRQNSDPISQGIASDQAIINAVSRLLRLFKPSHVVAVFDGEMQSWRHQLYPDYKATRNAMPQALAKRLPMLQDSLLEIGVDSLYNAHVEADDLIATLASKAQHHGVHSTIVSTDSGFCQLLPLGVSLYDHFNREFTRDEQVLEKYQLAPSQLIDYWALTGNSGLNLKGVAGVGKKSALKLLQQFGNLENILSSDNPDKLVVKVQANRSDAELTKQLITLRQDMPLGFSLKELRWEPAPVQPSS
jgi:protein Xni